MKLGKGFERKKKATQQKFEVQDIVKDFIWDIIVAAVTFVWLLLMQLIVSFVTSGYLHFEFENMVIISVIGSILMLIWKLISSFLKFH